MNKASHIKRSLVSLAKAFCIGGLFTATVLPQVAYAAPSPSCTSNFLGFPAWYNGLLDGKCNVVSPDGKAGSTDPLHPTLSNFIWHIGLNIVEIALVAVLYISAIFTIYGGFMFMTSQGKPDNAAKARMTMLDATIGLVISFAAVIAVNFIISKLGG